MLQKAEHLKSIVSPTEGFCLNTPAILEELLHGIFLEETLAEVLQKIYVEEQQVSVQVQQLENLVTRYQKSLINNSYVQPTLYELEQQIFLILGFKRIIVKIEDIVTAFNQIYQAAKNYLGAILTNNAWESTRPESDWLKTFKVERHQITSSINNVTMNASQLQSIQEWITAFVAKISQTIKDFASSIEQKRIGELPGGVLITNVNSYPSWIAVNSIKARSY